MNKIKRVIIALERRIALALGKTQSNKLIHSHYDHPEHKNFGWQEHHDAVKAHLDAITHGGDKKHHLEQAQKHHAKSENMFQDDMQTMGL